MDLIKGRRYVGTTTAFVDWRRVYNDVAFTAARDQTVDDGDDIKMVRVAVLKHPRHSEAVTRLYLAGSIREVGRPMSVKSAQLYWVECDGCGRRPEDDYVEMVHDSRAEAIEDALGGDWYKVGRYQHACGDCMVSWDGNDVAYIKSQNLNVVRKEPDHHG